MSAPEEWTLIQSVSELKPPMVLKIVLEDATYIRVLIGAAKIPDGKIGYCMRCHTIGDAGWELTPGPAGQARGQTHLKCLIPDGRLFKHVMPPEVVDEPASKQQDSPAMRDALAKAALWGEEFERLGRTRKKETVR